MNEKQPYEKHLAEKLESLPPPGESNQNWPAMKALLDQQMPATGGRRPGGSWWIYGIIVGVFVIGTWLFIKQDTKDSALLAKENTVTETKATTEASSGVKKNNDHTISSNQQNSTNQIDELNSTPNNTADNQVSAKEEKGAEPTVSDLKQTKQDSEPSADKSANANNEKESANRNTAIESAPNANRNSSIKLADGNSTTYPSSAVKNKRIGSETKASFARTNKKSDAKKFEAISDEGRQESTSTKKIDKFTKNSQISKNNQSGYTALEEQENDWKASSLSFGNDDDVLSTRNNLFWKIDSIANNYATALKPTVPVARSRFKESTERTKALKNRVVGTGEEKNFVIGLTLPLSMPLSDQKVLAYNVNAGVNTVSDYIPSPNIQYHLSRSTYLQAEIQIASPQLIQPVLLSQSKYELSGQQGAYRFMSQSIFARKLYYFNLPIGINYSPFKNFYLGTGLQFSSLMSGIGFSETRGFNSLGPGSRDTLFSSGFFKFRNDSLSGRLNSNEVRLSLDANYYWKKFTLGMRYNQALNNYVSLQLNPNSPVFTDRNKALQIYLRYNLWEDKKKKKTSSVARR